MQNIPNTLHDEARRRFNVLGAELLTRVIALPARGLKGGDSSFKPDTFSSLVVTEDVIDPDMEISTEDISGKPTTLAFLDANGARVGLYGEGLDALLQLATAMHRVSPFRDIATEEDLRKKSFMWLKATSRGDTSGPLVDWVLQQLDLTVRQYEVVTPIVGLHIQSDVVLGHVTLKTFPKPFFDQFEMAGSEAADQTGRPAHLAWCKEVREQFQGVAAAHVRVIGTPQRAIEVAYEQTDLAIGAFRLFAISHFQPRFVSQWAPFRVSRKKTIFVGDGQGKCIQVFDALIDKQASMVVDDSGLRLAQEMGLADLQQVLAKRDRTSFDDGLLGAIGLFGRAALTSDYRERLVWYCSGLESLLLKDASEPVLQNLSERLALFSYETVDERQKAIAELREAYGTRSRFVHHGFRVDDANALESLARHGFRFFCRAIQSASKFADKNAFIQHIDSIKLAGQAPPLPS